MTAFLDVHHGHPRAVAAHRVVSRGGGPAAVYLVVVGETTGGVLLALYGRSVVSLFDSYARPIVIDRRAHLNPGVLLIGVVGGIYAIGFTGVFVGPIVIGVLAVSLETFRTEFDAV